MTQCIHEQIGKNIITRNTQKLGQQKNYGNHTTHVIKNGKHLGELRPKIDGRVLLSAASDTKIKFVDNGRKKNSKKCHLMGVLVTFRGLAKDGSNHEYNGST